MSFAASYGPVDSVKVIRDRETQQSKCFGFIYMQTVEDASKVSGSAPRRTGDCHIVVVNMLVLINQQTEQSCLMPVGLVA